MNDQEFLRDLVDLVETHRTIVSSGSDLVVEKLLDYLPTGEVLSFASGLDDSNWIIPGEWKLLTATLSDLNEGTEILTEKDSVLFVAPYSKSCDLVLTKSELCNMAHTDPNNPGDFRYQHRLAYDPSKTMKEIGISIPWSILEGLQESSQFKLTINTSLAPGSMKIFRGSTSSEPKDKVFLLSHYCHSGQLNDGLAGVFVMGRVFRRLLENSSTLRREYVWLSFPETIGSSVYLHNRKSEIGQSFFSIFSEMPGAVSPIRITSSRRKHTYIDRLMQKTLQESNLPFNLVDFREGWGNDEMVFDSTNVGIPSISVDRAPFPQYHLSSDNSVNFDIENVEIIVDLITRSLLFFDRDFIPEAKFIVPPQLSRIGLYKDWSTNKVEYSVVMALLEAVGQGKSVVDIAISLNISIEKAFEFFESLSENNLILKTDLTPEYTRILQ
jgi:aminopeptidase-like protein